MARQKATPKTSSGGGSSASPGNSSSGSGLSGQIAAVAEQIEREKLTQKENKLTAEQQKTPILQQIEQTSVEILDVNLQTKRTSLEIAQTRGEKEGIGLTGAQQDRDLAQELTAIKREFNDEKISRERRRLYEFDGVSGFSNY
ncbi:MAG: hypothetical protein KME15_27760 [Drouetiella hepatica Uher 2000/2452]|jgi:hypothetical protein|uniref:Uncharacterized protein n=1 Tax=Drouetiella hepatica Uher 2000/2452 TaxID=904376 RepID=A0A951QIP3_9CYAN|nr:hypothetical protein [Drouetiella hepatica Uher 2000/2452]